MPSFYIRTSEGDILEMTSTTSVNLVDRASVSQHKLESGRDAADNVVNNNVQITFNGIITNIRRFEWFSNPDDRPISGAEENTQKNVVDYVTDLRALKASRVLFEVFWDERFPPAKNCAMTNVSLDRNTQTGTAYELSISLEQLRLSERAKLVEVQKQTNPDNTQESTSASNNSTEDVGPEETGALQLGTNIYELALGGNEEGG